MKRSNSRKISSSPTPTWFPEATIILLSSIGTTFAIRPFRNTARESFGLNNVSLSAARLALDKEILDMIRNRHKTLLWMKDLLDHMNQCHEQLQWAGDGPTEAFLAESLMVDLSECRKLCEQLKSPTKKNAGLVASF